MSIFGLVVLGGFSHPAANLKRNSPMPFIRDTQKNKHATKAPPSSSSPRHQNRPPALCIMPPQVRQVLKMCEDSFSMACLIPWKEQKIVNASGRQSTSSPLAHPGYRGEFLLLKTVLNRRGQRFVKTVSSRALWLDFGASLRPLSSGRIPLKLWRFLRGQRSLS